MTTRKTAMNTPAQAQAASAESRCPLASSKACRQSLWCHDKCRQAKDRARGLEETPVIHALPGSASSQRERAAAARLARATPSSSRVERGSLQRNRTSHPHAQPAIAPMRAVRYRLHLRLGIAHLRWLETLQALARIRCWLLRNCLCPFLRPRINDDGNDCNAGDLS